MTGTIKISELNAAASLTGTEEVPIVAGGATKRTTTLAIANLATASTSITVGATPIANGTTSRVLYDNNGVLGEYTISGTGSVVMTNSPTLITPALGVPTSLTLTNATALPVGGISATGTPSASTFLRGDGSWATPAGSGTVTSVAQTFTGGLISVAGSPITSSGTLALTVTGTSGGIPYFSSSSAWASSGALAANALVIGGGAGSAPSTTTTGTGVLTALGTNVGSAGAFVTFNGALGTPSSGTLTNATGLPISTGVSGLGAGVATFLATPSSANLAAAVTDETGSGALVFANTPTFVTPVLGAATGTSVSVTAALTAYSGTAIPAGGTTGSGIKFSSTSNFGVFFGSGAPTLSAAQGAIYLRSDGTSSTGVYTNTDGATTWAAIGGGGGGTPGGSTTQVQYNNAGAFAGDSGFTYSSSNKAITLGGATVTASAPVLDLSQTWNSGGTTFTGLKLNVTDTASASGSLLLDLQAGSASQAKIGKTGIATFVAATSFPITVGTVNIAGNDYPGIWFASSPNSANYSFLNDRGSATIINDATSVQFRIANQVIAQNSSAGFVTAANKSIGFSSSNSSTSALAAADTILARDAANTLALRNSTSAQTFNWYFSYTDGSNYARGALKTASGYVEMAAETAGTGADNINVKLTPAGTGTVQFGTHSAIAAETVTGYITITDAGGTTRKLAVVS